GTSAAANSSPMPSDPGSTTQLICGNGNGAFQPPRNRTVVSAETTNTPMYSAKKRTPKGIPAYSGAKPATISESASVRSNGVRLASAVAAIAKIRKPSGWGNANPSGNQPRPGARP